MHVQSQTFCICNDDCCSDFVHITEMHRHLFNSLIVASNAKSFSLVSINSMRKEKIWDWKLMEITPWWQRASKGAPSLLFYGELHETFLLMLSEAGSLLKPEQIKGEKWQEKRQSSVQWTTGCGGFSLDLQLRRCSRSLRAWEMFQADPRKKMVLSGCPLEANFT